MLYKCHSYLKFTKISPCNIMIRQCPRQALPLLRENFGLGEGSTPKNGLQGKRGRKSGEVPQAQESGAD
jgi:hypothetical protein